MTFNPNIPQGAQLISATQAQIQINFDQLNSIFDVDHVTYDNATVANRGKHDKSTYIEQGSDPATSANEIALYSKDLSSVSTLYMRKESSGTVIQMSGRDPILANPGRTFLPGGIILVWGTFSLAPGVNSTAVTFPGGGFTGTPFGVYFGSNVTGNAESLPIVGPGTLTNTGFTGQRANGSSGGTYLYYYLAIGI
jgi:hypothetical protein